MQQNSKKIYRTAMKLFLSILLFSSCVNAKSLSPLEIKSIIQKASTKKGKYATHHFKKRKKSKATNSKKRSRKQKKKRASKSTPKIAFKEDKKPKIIPYETLPSYDNFDIHQSGFKLIKGVSKTPNDSHVVIHKNLLY